MSVRYQEVCPQSNEERAYVLSLGSEEHGLENLGKSAAPAYTMEPQRYINASRKQRKY